MKPLPSKLYCVDCLAGLSKIEPGSVRLAFADPPFNVGYEYDVYDDRKARHDYLDWSRRWIQAVHKVLSPDGTFWLAIGDEYAAELKLIAQEEIGFTCRSWVIWYYTFGVHCKTKFTRSHAHLFYFVKNPKKFTFNASMVRVPSARQLVYADSRADPDGRVPDDTWILRPQDVPGGFKAEENTWFISRVCGTFKQRAGWHGCQMPERLLERIIRVSSNPGDLVLDPFAGSGTTLAVAKKLHRQWIGFEVSRTYVRRAMERLTRVKSGDPIEGPENPFGTAPPTAAGKRLGERRAAPRSPKQANLQRAGASPVIQRLNFSLGQIAASNGELTTAVAEAYLAASDGYAIDRVLADPRLNIEFHKACCDLGIPGQPPDWNRRLLALRKGGRLRGLPRPRQTSIPWPELDQFVFASELAWRIVSDSEHGASLDDILCDPRLTERFDETASRFAPGWTPFEYRWGALTVRKMAGRIRNNEKARGLDAIKKQLERRRFRLDNVERVPSTAGLYALYIPGVPPLYLGESSSLQRRLELHRDHLPYLLPRLHQDLRDARDVTAGVFETPNEKQRSIHRVMLVAKLCPLGNHNPSRRAG
jgi:DNA modification methylase